MRTIGIKPGDAVLVVEHRGEQQIVYNALVAGICMDDKLAGTQGEPAIEAAFVVPQMRGTRKGTTLSHVTLNAPEVVHISHRDWTERRASLGYEELPALLIGVCTYCHCTDRRGCPGGCHWLDEFHTVCSRCEQAYLDSITVEVDAGGSHES
jgi:hypothetical protein